jgi:hypothetical protein
MSILTVRHATKRETLEILSEEQISNRLDNKPAKIVKDKHNVFILVIWQQYRLLVTYKKIGNNAVDCHLACPRNSLPAAKVLALLGMSWLLTDTNIDVNTLTTSTMKGSMSNFAKKLGFVKIYEDETKDYFTYP